MNTSIGTGRAGSHPAAGEDQGGWTLLEIMIISAVILALAMIAVPLGYSYVKSARINKAIGEMRLIVEEISGYKHTNRELPASLDEVGWGHRRDPWGNPYQFLNFKLASGKTKMRKDKFLVPINTDYDLYSMGPDGVSAAPLTANGSRDDIVRANDGDFIGIAEEY